MKIVSVRWLPYRLPLRRPWVSAAGSLVERSGRLLRLKTDDGRNGWGDCAPFPEIGIHPPAAQRHAEQCALLDLAAQAAGLPLATWLRGGTSGPAGVAVNAVLGNLSGLRDEDVEAALATGFTILKLKVGNADPAEEIGRLHQLAARLPEGIALRLDANRAWDDATAGRVLAACAGLPIESCEEPLRSPSATSLGELQSDLPFPLAIDESFHLVDEAFYAAPPVRRLVLKPPRHGGLLPALEVAFRARAAGVDCVVTSSLESACGLLAAAHLAAAVGPELAHGLATAGWFAADTGAAPAIRGGRLQLPDIPGIGFTSRIS